MTGLTCQGDGGAVWIDARGTGGGSSSQPTVGLVAWHPDTGRVSALADQPELAHLADHSLYGVSADGGVLALGRETQFRGRKTDLVVVHRDGTELLRTRDHLVWSVVFAHDARSLLIESLGRKPRRFVFDPAVEQYVDAGVLTKDFRVQDGSLDPLSDCFVAASTGRTPGRVTVADLSTGAVTEVQLKLGRVKSVTCLAEGGGFLVRSGDAIVTRFSRDWEPVWQVDGAPWPGAPAADQPELGTLQLAHAVRETRDGSLLTVSVHGSTTLNDWGIDYVLDPATGELLRVIEADQGRGITVGTLTETRVLLASGRSLDLASGEVSTGAVSAVFAVE